MAGTANQSYGGAEARFESRMNRVELPWTSDGSGAATVSSPAACNGVIHEVRFKPGAGTSQPTNGYNVVVANSEGVDVLAGRGASLSNTTATAMAPAKLLTDGTNTTAFPYALANEPLTATVLGAGPNKSGLIVVLLR